MARTVMTTNIKDFFIIILLIDEWFKNSALLKPCRIIFFCINYPLSFLIKFWSLPNKKARPKSWVLRHRQAPVHTIIRACKKHYPVFVWTLIIWRFSEPDNGKKYLIVKQISSYVL